MQHEDRGESMRTEHGTCMDMRCDTYEEGVDDEASEPRRGNGDDSSNNSDKEMDGHATIEGAGSSEPVPETIGPENSAPRGVKAGYEGRARRGASKAGGYDETPRRSDGRRKPRGVRIRYVDNVARGGGTTEQGIRMEGVRETTSV